jgi:hypothetical protein
MDSQRSDNSVTPSFVSTRSRMTRAPTTMSPDTSTRDVIESTPLEVPFRSTRRSSDHPLPSRPLTRRSSTGRDIMLSSLEQTAALRSSMQLSYPTSSSAISTTTHDDEFGNSQIISSNHRTAAAPPMVICSNNGTDTESNVQLLENMKCPRRVSNMAYTDPFGDSGLYTGEVDEESRHPHGRGKLKYDNGIYFEGSWCNGFKNDSIGGASTICVQHDGCTREQEVFSTGFTSWTKNKSTDLSDGEKGRFVYGMDWLDPAGLSGKYTGRVNEDDVPDGNGTMRYHCGLIAEGDWIKGVFITRDKTTAKPVVADDPSAI